MSSGASVTPLQKKKLTPYICKHLLQGGKKKAFEYIEQQKGYSNIPTLQRTRVLVRTQG